MFEQIQLLDRLQKQWTISVTRQSPMSIPQTIPIDRQLSDPVVWAIVYY